VVVVAVLAACSSAVGGAGPDPHRRLVDAITRDLRVHPAVPGEAVSVRAPGLDVAAARGDADVAAGTPLRVDTPFRIASVTKTFVAVAVLRLVEQGDLALTAPIARVLSPASTGTLVEGGYRPDRITVRELLDHTSGLYDYAASDAYDEINTQDPGRHWTRAEQLAFAMDRGHPLAAPGRAYHYADTNYVLLGEILERVTGQPMAAAVRTEIGFGRLGLDHTFWEGLEPTPAGTGARAHQYYGTTFDNIALDASSDLYGGGGLVSTVGDVSRFFRALFDGRVFRHDRTLDEMLTVSKPGRHDGAALGIFETTIAGERCWGHPGYWGTEAYACPDLSLAFALTTNQANEADLDTTAVERTIIDLARSR
jgi:D-alanyl-D-alanine carboxypeptidase